jgi:hypothetical protein
MKTKSQTDMIEEALVHRHGLHSGSAITMAVAYVIFGQYHSRLVNHMGSYREMWEAVTPQMVLDAIRETKAVLGQFEGTVIQRNK